MGTNISRRTEPEVHVVVVQSQENGQVDAKVLRKSYTDFKDSRMKSGSFIHVFADVHVRVHTRVPLLLFATSRNCISYVLIRGLSGWRRPLP